MSVSSDSEVTDARETDRNPAFIALLKQEIGMTLDSASETTGLLSTKKNRKGAKNRQRINRAKLAAKGVSKPTEPLYNGAWPQLSPEPSFTTIPMLSAGLLLDQKYFGPCVLPAIDASRVCTQPAPHFITNYKVMVSFCDGCFWEYGSDYHWYQTLLCEESYYKSTVGAATHPIWMTAMDLRVIWRYSSFEPGTLRFWNDHAFLLPIIKLYGITSLFQGDYANVLVKHIRAEYLKPELISQDRLDHAIFTDARATLHAQQSSEVMAYPAAYTSVAKTLKDRFDEKSLSDIPALGTTPREPEIKAESESPASATVSKQENDPNTSVASPSTPATTASEGVTKLPVTLEDKIEMFISLVETTNDLKIDDSQRVCLQDLGKFLVNSQEPPATQVAVAGSVGGNNSTHSQVSTQAAVPVSKILMEIKNACLGNQLSNNDMFSQVFFRAQLLHKAGINLTHTSLMTELPQFRELFAQVCNKILYKTYLGDSGFSHPSFLRKKHAVEASTNMVFTGAVSPTLNASTAGNSPNSDRNGNLQPDGSVFQPNILSGEKPNPGYPGGDPDGDDPDGGGGNPGGFRARRSPGHPRTPIPPSNADQQRLYKIAYDDLHRVLIPKIVPFYGQSMEAKGKPVGTTAVNWLYTLETQLSLFYVRHPVHTTGLLLPTVMSHICSVKFFEVGHPQTAHEWFQKVVSDLENLFDQPWSTWTFQDFFLNFHNAFIPANWQWKYMEDLKSRFKYESLPEDNREDVFIVTFDQEVRFIEFYQNHPMQDMDKMIILKSAFRTGVNAESIWHKCFVEPANPMSTSAEFKQYLKRQATCRQEKAEAHIVAFKNGREIHDNLQDLHAPVPPRQNGVLYSINNNSSFVQHELSTPAYFNSMDPMVASVQEPSFHESEFCQICDTIQSQIAASTQYFAMDNAIPNGEDGRPLLPAKRDALCHKCQQTGHFSRDCPDLGGKGISWIGQRNGTAKGFRKDEIRPEWFTQAQAARRPKIAAFRNATANKGQNTTYARTQRRGAANMPSQMVYQHLNVLSYDTMEDYLYHFTDIDYLLSSSAPTDENPGS